jgi:hypothetical protein
MIRKIFLFSVVLLIGLSSCKKDRACVCTQKDGAEIGTEQYTRISRKDANNLCSARQSQLQSSNPGASCSLR